MGRFSKSKSAGRGARTSTAQTPSKGRLRIARAGAANTRTLRRGSLRFGRIANRWTLAVVALILLFYIAPVHNYMRQRGETSAKKEELRQLGIENRQLRQRAKALTRDSVIELEARKLGMVRVNERPFVIVQ
ncbi:MAG: septum formation initiator family protein [Thermoleophilaceae bacterium]|nr:septum formation initiator family protein [Thermoleophilaceae bacterium]